MGRPSRMASKVAKRAPGVVIKKEEDVDPDLELECYDDELSDAQNAAVEQAMTEYRDALKQIEEARAKLAQATTEKESTTADHENSGYMNGNEDMHSPVDLLSDRSSSPDVIMLDDDDCIVTTPSLTQFDDHTSVSKARGRGRGRPPRRTRETRRDYHEGAALGTLSVDVDSSHASVSTPSPVGSNASSGGMWAGEERSGKRTTKRASSAAVAVLTAGFKKGRKKDIKEEQQEEFESTAASAISPNVPGHHTSGSWIPLEEFYYASRAGSTSYREEKGEFRFKCGYCHNILFNNVNLMSHLREHFELNERSVIYDLNSLTQCSQCQSKFSSALDLKQHMHKTHDEADNSQHTCRICEKELTSDNAIRSHMRQIHRGCEMPYVCQLCSYRSSVYTDLLEHFVKRHDSSPALMCVICLKTMTIKPSKKDNTINTAMYYSHVQKHLNRGFDKKCKNCRLSFFSKTEAFAHVQKDHMFNSKGLLGDGDGISSKLRALQKSFDHKIEINVSDSSSLVGGTSSNLRHLNLPFAAKAIEYRSLKVHSDENLMCCECHQPLNKKQHFRNYVQCGLCHFASTCRDSYTSHVTLNHGGGDSYHLSMKDVTLTEPLYCACGYQASEGFNMAQHLTCCGRRTCYAVETFSDRVKVIEYDAEDEEEVDPLAPLDLDIEDEEEEEIDDDDDLSTARSSSKRFNTVSHNVASGIIDDLLNDLFPAEAAAAEFLQNLIAKVNEHIGVIERARAMRAVGDRKAAAARQQRAAARAAEAERIAKEAAEAKRIAREAEEAAAREAAEAEAAAREAVEAAAREAAEAEQAVAKEAAEAEQAAAAREAAIAEETAALETAEAKSPDSSSMEQEPAAYNAAETEADAMEVTEFEKVSGENVPAKNDFEEERHEDETTTAPDESLAEEATIHSSDLSKSHSSIEQPINDINKVEEKVENMPCHEEDIEMNSEIRNSEDLESYEKNVEPEAMETEQNYSGMVEFSSPFFDQNPSKEKPSEDNLQQDADIFTENAKQSGGDYNLEGHGSADNTVNSKNYAEENLRPNSSQIRESLPQKDNVLMEKESAEGNIEEKVLVEEKAESEGGAKRDDETSGLGLEKSDRSVEDGGGVRGSQSELSVSQASSSSRERSEASESSRHGDDRRRDSRAEDRSTSSRHGDDRRRDDRYSDDRRRDDRHRDDRYRDDRHRDDRDDRRRDDRDRYRDERSDRHRDDRYRDDRHRDDRHRDERDDRHRDDRYRDDRHRDDRRRDERDDRRRDDRHRDDRDRRDRDRY